MAAWIYRANINEPHNLSQKAIENILQAAKENNITESDIIERGSNKIRLADGKDLVTCHDNGKYYIYFEKNGSFYEIKIDYLADLENEKLFTRSYCALM